MNSKRFPFAQRAAAMAVSLLLGTSAQAIVVTGTFDPSFGSPFPNLGYRGIGKVFVDDACLAANGFVWWDASCGGSLQYGQAMGLLSATGEMYDARLLPGTPPTLASVTFQSTQPNPGNDLPMWGVYIQGGQVLGFDTLPIGQQAQGPINGNTGLGSPDNSNLWPGGFFDLYFESGHYGEGCDLGTSFCSGGGSGFAAGLAGLGPAGLPSGAVLISLTNCNADGCVRNDTSGNPAPMRFSQVPEPGTLALLLSALGGGWFAKRRRKPAG
jgi:hypothetical protein